MLSCARRRTRPAVVRGGGRVQSCAPTAVRGGHVGGERGRLVVRGGGGCGAVRSGRVGGDGCGLRVVRGGAGCARAAGARCVQRPQVTAAMALRVRKCAWLGTARRCTALAPCRRACRGRGRRLDDDMMCWWLLCLCLPLNAGI